MLYDYFLTEVPSLSLNFVACKNFVELITGATKPLEQTVATQFPYEEVFIKRHSSQKKKKI